MEKTFLNIPAHLLLALLGVVVFLGTLFLLSELKEKEDSSLYSQLRAGIEECSTKEVERNACYVRFAREMLTEHSLMRIMKVLDEGIGSRDPLATSECHAVGHYFGREAYRQSRDIGRVFEESSHRCLGGALHGAAEAYLAESGVSPDNSSIAGTLHDMCAPYKDDMPQNIYFRCIHGAGHAVMLLTNTDAFRSYELCDSFDTDLAREQCYSGVAMEYFISATGDAHLITQVNPELPYYPCTDVDSQYKRSCYMWQAFYLALVNDYDYQESISECSTAPEEGRDWCFQGSGMASGIFIARDAKDPVESHEVCTFASKNISKQAGLACVRGGVAAVVDLELGNPQKIDSYCAHFEGLERETCVSEGSGLILIKWAASSRDFIASCWAFSESDAREWCMELVPSLTAH